MRTRIEKTHHHGRYTLYFTTLIFAIKDNTNFVRTIAISSEKQKNNSVPLKLFHNINKYYLHYFVKEDKKRDDSGSFDIRLASDI